jgi:hypothetical protein
MAFKTLAIKRDSSGVVPEGSRGPGLNPGILGPSSPTKLEKNL